MTNTFLPLTAMPNLSWADVQDILNAKKNNQAENIVSYLIKRYSSEHEQNKQPSVLNMYCNTGSYLVEFAKKGWQTYGVDSDYQNLESTILKQIKTAAKTRLFQINDDAFKKLRELDMVVFFDTGFAKFALDAALAEKNLELLKTFLKKTGMVVIEVPPALLPFTKMITLNNEMPATVQKDISVLSGDGSLIEEVTTLQLENEGESIVTQDKCKLKLWSDEQLISMVTKIGFTSAQKVEIADRSFIISITN